MRFDVFGYDGAQDGASFGYWEDSNRAFELVSTRRVIVAEKGSAEMSLSTRAVDSKTVVARGGLKARADGSFFFSIIISRESAQAKTGEEEEESFFGRGVVQLGRRRY